MNRKGFTLSEMLIALGIIGILAAISVPAIVGNLPSRSKVNFLKAYGSLSSIIADITSDEDLYYYKDDSCPNVNLTCTDRPMVTQPSPANTNYINARDKLAKLVASKMNLAGGYANYSFTTTDGTVWTFNAPPAGKLTRVTMRVLGDDDTTKTFTATIDNDGGIELENFEGYYGKSTKNDLQRKIHSKL